MRRWRQRTCPPASTIPPGPRTERGPAETPPRHLLVSSLMLMMARRSSAKEPRKELEERVQRRHSTANENEATQRTSHFVHGKPWELPSFFQCACMENPKSTAIFEAGAFAKVIFSTIDVELRGHVDKNVSAAPSFSKPYRVTIAGEGMPVETRVRHVRREVRPQYSTLHLQIRVNAGDVCPGRQEEGGEPGALRCWPG